MAASRVLRVVQARADRNTDLDQKVAAVGLKVVHRVGVHRDLRTVDLRTVDLRTVDLVTADLVTADLVTADLVMADLVMADLVMADLVMADLVMADLAAKAAIVRDRHVAKVGLTEIVDRLVPKEKAARKEKVAPSVAKLL